MRLIDADALIANKFKNPISYNAFVSLVKRQPTEPVRHGRWIDMGDFISCSVCTATRMKEFLSDYGVAMRLDARTDYCPNCGAKMDGGAEDEHTD